MTVFVSRTVLLTAILLNLSLASGQNPPAGPTKAAPAPAANVEQGNDSSWAVEPYSQLTDNDLRHARRRLRRAADRLDARLAQDGPNGQAWRKYLKWDELVAPLQADGELDPKALDEVYSQLNAPHTGLDLVWFVDVRQAVKHYLNVARGMDKPEIAAAYAKLIKTLPNRLDKYVKNPTTREAVVLGQIVGWLEDFRQAKALVREIRDRLRRPNLIIEVSDSLVAAGMNDKVDDTAPVVDCILGTSISGTGHTTGDVAAQLAPDDHAAVIELLFRGQTASNTIGRNGPVRIYSNGMTTLEATKRLVVDAEGIEALPSVAKANTTTNIHAIKAVRGGKFVERIAWRRAGRDKHTAEAIASNHAEARLNRRIDAQAEAKVAQANDDLNTKLHDPLFAHRLWPETLTFTSSERVIRVEALQAGRAQLAAPALPPAQAKQADLAVFVHESMINNAAATLLAGRTLSEAEFLKTVEEILGEVPERLRAQQNAEPWAISFASAEPFTVSFDDDGFVVTMRANGYFRGEKEYPAMNVKAVYKIERDAKGLLAVRQGDLEVVPPDYQPDKSQLSAREQTIRQLLTDRMNRVFEKKLKPRGALELRGQWKKAGELQLENWGTADGWMTLTWQRPTK